MNDNPQHTTNLDSDSPRQLDGGQTATSEKTLETGTFFSHSENVNISGGRFWNICSPSSNQTLLDAVERRAKETEQSRKLDRAMEILRPNIAPGASYDCVERADVPKCHTGTREAIIANIRQWVTNPKDNEKFLWVYGPAGCGKTTIAETIAQICDDEGRLAGSFFFSRLATGRPKTHTNLIATLVNQLWFSIPNFRDYAALEIDYDPQIFSKALSKQLERLLIEPIKKVIGENGSQNPSTFRRNLIIIDGLDECEGLKSQVQVLELLAQASRQLPSALLFLILSRPEHNIRTAFASDSMHPCTRGIPLDNDYQIDTDIRKFLESRFALIRKEHPAGANLPANWPSREDLDYLVKKSSGQFIYPSLVMNWLESIHHSPKRRLEEVLTLSSPGSGTDLPFAQLDALYAHVLSQIDPENRDLALKILFWMINDSSRSPKTLEFSDKLFSCDPGYCQIVLTGLSALIYLPEPLSEYDPEDDPFINGLYESDEESDDDTQSEASESESEYGSRHDRVLRFFHASFPDYLMDSSRSGGFFINTPTMHANFARDWIKYYAKTTDPPRAPGAMDAFGLTSFDITRTIFSHCGSASLTLELKNDLGSLDLKPILAIVGPRPETFWWPQLYLILNFIIWLKLQIPSDPELSLYHHHLQDIQTAIQIHFSQYPLEARDYIPTVMTFPHRFPILEVQDVVLDAMPLSCVMSLIGTGGDCTFDFLHISALDWTISVRDEEILDPLQLTHHWEATLFAETKTLLCELLTNSKLITRGMYINDRNIYTELAVFMAKALVAQIRNQVKVDQIDFDNLAASFCLVLSKASADIGLASLLRDQGTQVDVRTIEALERASQLDDDSRFLLICRCLLANLVYIKESGIPFRAHAHPPDFDSEHWYCVICATKESEDELSVDPAPEAGFLGEHFLARFAAVPQAHRINFKLALEEMLKRAFVIR